MNFSQTYFELFDVPPSFVVDASALAEKYRQLQRDLHPDRFAGQGASEQRLAVQYASQINTAYQTLRTPVLRAGYLLSLVGRPVDNNSLTINDKTFLFKQMEWREVLADLSVAISKKTISASRVSEDLAALTQQTKIEQQQLLLAFDQCYQSRDYDHAKLILAKLHFVEKMLVDIDRLEDSLLD